MKKHYLLIICLLILSRGTYAQNPLNFSSPLPNSGEMLDVKVEQQKKKGFAAFKFLVPDNTHDFGTIPEGPKATYEFQFVNIGTEPLVITNAQASCGCTSPEFPKEPILPGKKGKISVTYSTEGRIGNFNKSIYITSNAQSPNGSDRYELFIKGIVIPSAKASK